jgi:hypothetical protein
MPRLKDAATQRNLWGASADSGGSAFEPQRVDLWTVDFTNAVNGINAFFGQQVQFNDAGSGLVQPPKIPPIFPQYVQSVSIPENRLKPDVFRRESIPYQMPSWDDPLDPVKITFLMETASVDDSSFAVSNTQLLMLRWMQLVRAGRGERSSGYLAALPPLSTVVLNDSFQAPYRFDVSVFLIRGKVIGAAAVSPQVLAQQNAIDQNTRVQQQKVRNALQMPDVELSASLPARGTPPVVQKPQFCELVSWQHIRLQQLWLAGFKISDLSYTQNGLVTIETTFYAESVDPTT